MPRTESGGLRSPFLASDRSLLALRDLALRVHLYSRRFLSRTYAPSARSGAAAKMRTKHLDSSSLSQVLRWFWPLSGAHLQLFPAIIRILRSQNRLGWIIPASIGKTNTPTWPRSGIVMPRLRRLHPKLDSRAIPVSPEHDELLVEHKILSRQVRGDIELSREPSTASLMILSIEAYSLKM